MKKNRPLKNNNVYACLYNLNKDRKSGSLRIINSKFIHEADIFFTRENPNFYKKLREDEFYKFITFSFYSDKEIELSSPNKVGGIGCFKYKDDDNFHYLGELVDNYDYLPNEDKWILLHWHTHLYFKLLNKKYDEILNERINIVNNINIDEIKKSLKIEFTEGHRHKPGDDDSYMIYEERILMGDTIFDDYIKKKLKLGLNFYLKKTGFTSWRNLKKNSVDVNDLNSSSSTLRNEIIKEFISSYSLENHKKYYLDLTFEEKINEIRRDQNNLIRDMSFLIMRGFYFLYSKFKIDF